MKKVLIFLIKIYQKTISPDHSLFGNLLFGPCCLFNPTCSDYCIQTINKFGLAKGLFMFLKRFLKCHPFSRSKFDPPY